MPPAVRDQAIQESGRLRRGFGAGYDPLVFGLDQPLRLDAGGGAFGEAGCVEGEEARVEGLALQIDGHAHRADQAEEGEGEEALGERDLRAHEAGLFAAAAEHGFSPGKTIWVDTFQLA